MPKLLIVLAVILVAVCTDLYEDWVPSGPLCTFGDVKAALDASGLNLKVFSSSHDVLYNTRAWRLEGSGIKHLTVLVFPKRVTDMPRNVTVDYTPELRRSHQGSWRRWNVLILGFTDSDATWSRVVHALKTLNPTGSTNPFDYALRLSELKQQAIRSASPTKLIELYFHGIREKDYEVALATLSPGYVEANTPERIVSGFEKLARVDNIAITADRGHLRTIEQYKITFDSEVKQDQTGERHIGTTTRFFCVSKHGGRWYIVRISASPQWDEQFEVLF